ncbi:hypothetical protein [Helicobacter labetoulli]|uniref:hypothetical protein n=1 Tax=Helicobacter labetoulli TaxID=2315333 RepID=UPI000EF70A3B|nr:hypothetical protein [Helicobacter labetoulli]
MKRLALVLGLGLIFAACGDNIKEKEAPVAPAPEQRESAVPLVEDPGIEIKDPKATEASAEANAEVKPESDASAASEEQTQSSEQKEEKAQ